METPLDQEQKISVLIMSYKRREFIKEALESVLNQTIQRSKYEIICAIGFHDDETSLFLSQRGVREIYSDGTSGKRLKLGLIECRNDIVVFLDDDDKFGNKKLELILDAFKKYNCVYYHNDVTLIDSKSNIIDHIIKPYDKQITNRFSWIPIRGYSKILKERGDFNMSSIAIRKSKLQLNILDKIEAGPDSIIFFLMMQTHLPFYFDASRTTFYRIHDSETNVIEKIDSDRMVDTALKYYNSRLIAYESMESPDVKKVFLGYVLESKFGAYIAGNRDLKPSISEMLKFLYIAFTRQSMFYLRLLIATVIYSAFPHFVDNVRYKRMRDRYKEIKQS